MLGLNGRLIVQSNQQFLNLWFLVIEGRCLGLLYAETGEVEIRADKFPYLIILAWFYMLFLTVFFFLLIFHLF